jgi:hypothetical protein
LYTTSNLVEKFLLSYDTLAEKGTRARYPIYRLYIDFYILNNKENPQEKRTSY